MAKKTGLHRKGKLHISPKKLRKLSLRDLRELDGCRFIVKDHQTFGVLVSYGMWMERLANRAT